MITYGIDVGMTKKTCALVKFDSTLGLLTRESPLKGFAHDLRKYQTEKTAEAVVTELVDEISANNLYPLAVDAALSVGSSKKGRKWETFVGGAFRTPKFGLPAAQAKGRTRNWRVLAYIWSRVAVELDKKGVLLWDGAVAAPVPIVKLLVEVYPRACWTSWFAACNRPFPEPYNKKIGWRETVLMLGTPSCFGPIAWSPGKRNNHVRDAAIAALTAFEVVQGAARFIGERRIAPGTQPVFTGGGIACL